MKKPTIISVLFFVLTAISSFGQGEGFWIEENVDPETGLRTGKIEMFFGEEIIEIKPNADLRDAQLRGFDLRNVNLQGANLSGAELSRADINGANLEGANLENARFSEISSGNLKGTPSALPDGYKIINGYLVGYEVSLYDANLEGADLQGMNLSYVSFRSANLEGVNLTGADLTRVIWIGVKGTPSSLPDSYYIINDHLVGPNANLESANFQGADLEGLNLNNAKLERANLKGANLKGANLERADLEGADLKGANLERADLEGADLEGADLEGADLEGANLKDSILFGYGDFPKNANFINANLKGVDIRGARFEISSSNIAALINSASNYEDIQELKAQIAEGGIGGGISPEQAAAIAANTNKINELDGILSSADETLEGFSQNIDILNANDQSIAEQMTTLSQNDEAIMTEINAMKAQLQTLVAQVAEKDQRIAELEQGGGGQSLEQVLEQVRDARAGSVVLTVEPDGNNITLGLTIEQSDNLTEWTKLDGEMTRTIPIPDGKKFYRFALDK